MPAPGRPAFAATFRMETECTSPPTQAKPGQTLAFAILVTLVVWSFILRIRTLSTLRHLVTLTDPAPSEEFFVRATAGRAGRKFCIWMIALGPSRSCSILKTRMSFLLPCGKAGELPGC